jgi:hypothetical protein
LAIRVLARAECSPIYLSENANSLGWLKVPPVTT